MKTKSSKIGIYVSALLFLAMTLGLAMPTHTAKADYATFDNPDYYYATVKVAPDGTTYRQASLNPDGTKILASKQWTDTGVTKREIVLMDADGSDEVIISPGDSGTGDIYGYMNPFWSDDGTAIGISEAHNTPPNKVMRYLVADGTRSYIYEPSTGSVPCGNACNPDFLGNSTTSIVFWEWIDADGAADLFTWDGTTLTNITNSPLYSEYEPVSNANGTVIVYWSGETTTESTNTTHTLTYSGGTWTKDVGFTPIVGTYWSFWSGRPDNYIGVVNSVSGGTSGVDIYDSTGTFVFDLTGPGFSGGAGQWTFVGNEGPYGEFALTSNAGRTTAGRDIVIANPRSVLYVASTGSDANPGTEAAPFRTIQKGINEVAAGGTVNVAAGTYTPASTITINKPLTIQGPRADVDPRPSAGTTRSAGNAAEAVIDGDSSALGQIFLLNADNVILNGLEVKAGTKDMIRQDNTHSGTIIRYNIIHDGRGDEGAQLANCTNCVMEYNYVYDIANPGDALNFADSNNSAIRYNEVTNIGSENAAIYVYGSSNMTIMGNRVYNVTQNDGIKLGAKGGADAAKTGGTISNNVIHGTNQDGISVYESNTVVSGNEVYNSTSENGAIYVAQGVSNITLQNNYIHDNTLRTTKWVNAAGILIGSAVNASTVTITGNSIVNTTPYAMFNMVSSTVNATHNWWGAASGPLDNKSLPGIPNYNNPSGGGNEVSSYVDYSPWCADEACTSIPPKNPSSFYGRIYNLGFAGKNVEAYIAGITGPAASVAITGTGPLTYAFDIPGDLSSTLPTKEGGVEDDVITFKIDSQVVGTGVWHSGTNVELNFATVTLGDLSQTYDGTTKTVTATTNPVGKTVSFTYSPTPPIDAGSYTVVASITSPNYAGTASGTLIVNPAPLSVTAIADSKIYDRLPYSGGNGVDYAGFVNSETPAVLGGSLAYGGTSQGAIVPGSYLITPSGLTSSNYTITFHDGTLTITAPTYPINLVPGWNLVSFNLQPVDPDPELVLSSIAGQYDLVYAWDALSTLHPGGNWMKYDNILLSPDTLDTLNEKMGFWIHMTSAATLTVAGSVPTTTPIALVGDHSYNAGGWNLVGYPSNVNQSPSDALVGTGFSLVFAFHASETADPWKLYDPAAPAYASDLTALSAGWGFWVKVPLDIPWNVAY